MTNEQAKREIENIDYYLQNHTDDYGERSHDAMLMAIKALQEQAEMDKFEFAEIDPHQTDMDDAWEQAKADRNEFYNWDAPIRHKADGEYISKEKAIIQLSWDLSEVELPRIKESLDKLPSVAIPADKGLIRAIQSVIDSSDFPEDKVHRVELMIRGEIDG